MAPPVRNITDAPLGAITATPKRLLNRLGVRVMKVRGVTSARRGRR